MMKQRVGLRLKNVQAKEDIKLSHSGSSQRQNLSQACLVLLK